QAHTRWTHWQSFDGEKRLPRGLDIVVKMSGQPAAKAAQQGLFWIERCTTVEGLELQPASRGFCNTYLGYERLDRNEFHSFVPGGQVNDGIAAVYAFAHPETATGSIERFVGSTK